MYHHLSSLSKYIPLNWLIQGFACATVPYDLPNPHDPFFGLHEFNFLTVVVRFVAQADMQPIFQGRSCSERWLWIHNGFIYLQDMTVLLETWTTKLKDWSGKCFLLDVQPKHTSTEIPDSNHVQRHMFTTWLPLHSCLAGDYLVMSAWPFQSCCCGERCGTNGANGEPVAVPSVRANDGPQETRNEDEWSRPWRSLTSSNSILYLWIVNKQQYWDQE